MSWFQFAIVRHEKGGKKGKSKGKEVSSPVEEDNGQFDEFGGLVSGCAAS